MARQGDGPSAALRTRGLRLLGRGGNPFTEEEDGSGACSAKKGSESAISPSRFAVQGAPNVFQMRGTERHLVKVVHDRNFCYLWSGIYSSALGAVKILWRIA
jgi:hypothetical protein